MIVWVSASSTFKTFQIQLTTKGKGKRENISKQKPEIHRIVKTWILKSTHTGCKYCCLLLLSFLSSSSSSFSLYIAICSVLFCSVYSSVSVYLWKKNDSLSKSICTFCWINVCKFRRSYTDLFDKDGPFHFVFSQSLDSRSHSPIKNIMSINNGTMYWALTYGMLYTVYLL